MAKKKATRRDPLPAKQISIGAQMVALRYANMTVQERSEAARNAANKRWERLNPEQRSAIAKKAAAKRKRNAR